MEKFNKIVKLWKMFYKSITKERFQVNSDNEKEDIVRVRNHT